LFELRFLQEYQDFFTTKVNKGFSQSNTKKSFNQINHSSDKKIIPLQKNSKNYVFSATNYTKKHKIFLTHFRYSL